MPFKEIQLCHRRTHICYPIGLKQERTTPAIEKARDAVIGNDCTYHNDQTMKYFEWHFDFHGGNKS